MAFQPGQSGNRKGRPRGIMDKRAKLRNALAKSGQKLLDLLIARAEGGDVDAAKFLFSRLIPPARDLPQSIDSTGESLAEIGASILQASLSGRISPNVAIAGLR